MHKEKETRQALIYGAAMLEFSCLVTQKSQKSKVQYIEMKLKDFIYHLISIRHPFHDKLN
jgi:hypothetical protein